MIVLTTMDALPECCYECPCNNVEHRIREADKERRSTYEYRPYWCPLKEVSSKDDCFIEIVDSMKLEPLDLKDFIFEEIRKVVYGRKITMRVSLDKGAFPPERAHATDAGLDLKTPVDFVVPAGGWAIVDTGVHVELPQNTCGMLKSKSGLNVRYGITGTGLIDEGFTGSIKVRLYNHGSEDYRFKAGDKVTQLAVIPCLYPDIEIVDQIQGGERGDNGYGSSGK